MNDVDEDMTDFDFCPVEQDPPEPCPKCGSDIIYGFGLAGGGYGAYELCDNDECDYFSKPPSLGPVEE